MGHVEGGVVVILSVWLQLMFAKAGCVKDNVLLCTDGALFPSLHTNTPTHTQERAKCYTPEKHAEIALDPYNFRPPGGESPNDVETRVRAFIDQVVLPACEVNGPPALVVGHGFAFKTLVRSLLGAAPGVTRNIHLDNTALVDVLCRPAGVPDSKGRVSQQDTWYILR